MESTSVALVTGGGRGLGAAIALAFAKAGHAVAIGYGADKSAAEKIAAQIKAAGAPSMTVKADVRSSAQVNAMMKKVADEWGRIDVLVNNAGQVRNRTIFKMTDEEWREVMAVNLDGPFYCTRAVLPIMRQQKGGSIVNIASYIAKSGARGAANYAAAKAGLITLTKNTAIEEGTNNIRANVFMPGFHVTDMNRDVFAKMEPQIRAQHLLPAMPDREEMARFLVTVAGLRTVTGQVFAFESRLP